MSDGVVKADPASFGFRTFMLLGMMVVCGAMFLAFCGCLLVI